jgi:large subunit ribosomal protein L9
MQVILLQDVEPLGRRGDKVNVKRGYARNYLIPRKLATEFTPKKMAWYEEIQRVTLRKRAKEEADAQKLAQILANKVFSFTRKALPDNKLFGSVTSQEIAERLAKEGLKIERKKILLEEPLKALGEYSIPVKLSPTVTGQIKVKILPEKTEKGDDKDA